MKYIGIIAILLFLAACNEGSNQNESESHEEHGHDEKKGGHEEEGHDEHGEEDGMQEVHLSDLKFNSLGIQVDTLPKRALSDVVEANGQLEVPPQHEATVTAVLGANVTNIKVIEGDKVSKGQLLGFLSHPNLVEVQRKYIQAYNNRQYLEKEMNRQKNLYEKEVGSGKEYQRALADYQSMNGEVKSYEAQLKQLNLNVAKVKAGEVFQEVPVLSPIDGYIEKVKVQIGQYVEPQREMFMIVNTEHVHADLMVFEKDVHKIKKDQMVYFTVQSAPNKVINARIYSVGKKFEQNPKAIHVHAEIVQKEDYLIPGMYINGKIHTKENLVYALPESAIIEEEGKPFIFTAEQHSENGKTEWAFKAVEVRTGMTHDGWVEIKLLEPIDSDVKIAFNGAYYLIAEMKKGSTSHSH